MLIPAIGSVNSFNKKANIASVNPTRNISRPSFGYGPEGHEYEHAAMKALEKHVKNIQEKLKFDKSIELTSAEEAALAFKEKMSVRMMNCSNSKESSDKLMDIMVSAAEKLGLISRDTYQSANSAAPQASTKMLDFVV